MSRIIRMHESARIFKFQGNAGRQRMINWVQHAGLGVPGVGHKMFDVVVL